jgi:hypothetical protein
MLRDANPKKSIRIKPTILHSACMPESEPEIPAANSEVSPVNPFSTGEGGAVFEFHVQASFVATLLVQGILPCLPPSQVTVVHLQAGHLGLHTDDVACEALDVLKETRWLICQIKHQIRVSTTDNAFNGAISAAWLDFRAMTAERRELDAFALVTGPISSAVAWDFRTMLEWARSSTDSTDFLRRMALPKYASDTARAHLQSVRKICDEANGDTVTDDELWRFLRCYHILSFDFDTADSQDLARVKTMLALAAQPRDAASGDSLWNRIFHFVSQRNPRAGSLTHENLPDDITASCGNLTSLNHGPVQRLREHARGVLRRIQTTIGHMQPLPRDEPCRRLAAAIEEHNFVVVTGPAGASKSALSRMALEKSFPDAPLFAFQATEFARTHLDQVLSEWRLTVSLGELSALFALHQRKCLLIESVEKLLEIEPREAFSMFLDEIAADNSWRVVFTCRQYSVEQVRDAFFRPSGISPTIIEAPLFDDEELRIVGEAIPALASILINDRTRRLLRNPYFLSKAALVNWGAPNSSQPIDEGRLRDTLWRQVVMREDMRREGLPLRRDRCFRALALQRAKTMRPFVPYDPGDEATVQALLDDELLVHDAESGGVATAHDVLEDWALVREVRAQFERTEGRPAELFSTLGHELAMRRSYRHWLQEALEGTDAAAIFRFATVAARADEVEAYWRDETLVSVMLSERAEQYVGNEEAALLADNKRLLRRMVHLLRVACKRLNPRLEGHGLSVVNVAESHFLVPDGPGWSALLGLIERNLETFGLADLPWVLGLLKDWRLGLGLSPSDALREAGLIAVHYWRLTDDVYVNEEQLRELAGVLLAVPLAIRAEFEALLEGISADEWNFHNAQLAERLLTSFDGAGACCALPAAVAKFAMRAWGLDQTTPTRPGLRGRRRERESSFGLDDEFHLRLFPPSALHGPFYFILRGDPQIGQRLIVDFVNTAIDRHIGCVREDRPGYQSASIDVRLGEGITVRQWANDQFWRMYRQAGFGPDVVTCALMALEKWLLDLAEGGADLREVCRGLLAASNNVAITAVVASVAVAHPERVGDVAMLLFRVRQFFEWDQVRSIADQVSTNSLLAGDLILPQHRIYHEERKQSDKLAHRRHNLEWLAGALQFTDMRTAIQDIIDQHRAALPPEEEQSDSIRKWRLLLHRADVRRHTMHRDSDTGHLIFTSITPEPELQRMVEEHAPVAAAQSEQVRLMNWGMACLSGKTEQHDPAQWQEMFASAERMISQFSPVADEHERLMVFGASSYVAAVCVRDHWQEMRPEQRAWCRSLLVSVVEEQQDSRDDFVEAGFLPFHGSRPAARVLPLLLHTDAEEENLPIRLAIAGAITHASDEVRDFAASGIRDYLWDRHPKTAWACVAGLVRWSEIKRECHLHEQRKSWEERGDSMEVARARLPELRAFIARGAAIEPRDVLTLDLSDWCGTTFLKHVLVIVASQPQSELAQDFHRHVAEELVRMWARNGERRDYHAEAAAMEHLAYFTLRAPPTAGEAIFRPIVEAVTGHPSDVAQCLQQLIIAEDQLHTGEHFWSLWKLVVDAFFTIERWEHLLRSERDRLAQLIETLFLQRVEWKSDARDWAPLHGHEQSLEMLFARTGHSAPAFSAFCELLSSIGSRRMLPSAISLLSERLTAGEPRRMLAGKMTLWNLEMILSGCIYGSPSTIRRSRDLLSASLHILNDMVEQGSSAAFRMREFIITPVGPAREDE